MAEKNQRIWHLISNVDRYVALVAGLGVAVLDITNVVDIPRDCLNSVNLAVLALVAYAFSGFLYRLRDAREGIRLEDRTRSAEQFRERLIGADR